MKNISENSYKANINSLIRTTKEIKKTEILPEKNIILKIKEKEYIRRQNKKNTEFSYLIRLLSKANK